MEGLYFPFLQPTRQTDCPHKKRDPCTASLGRWDLKHILPILFMLNMAVRRQKTAGLVGQIGQWAYLQEPVLLKTCK